MASPVAITIEGDSRGRAGLVSSFGSQRSYGTVKESSGIIARGRLCDFIIHSVHEEDTLQGLAVRYGVTIHHIQRLNNLWDSESIQSRAELKVPTSAAYSRSFTPSPKPRNKKLNHRMASSMQDIRHMDNERREGEEGEEDVKRKPSGRLREKRLSTEPFQEKSIASLLTAADERIAEMQRFNEKLAQKMAHLKQPGDAYNRQRPEPVPHVSLSPALSSQSDTLSSSTQSSLEVVAEKVKMSKKEEDRRRRMAKESSESLSNSRDTIEDHLFEL